jgi:hypothetical protein
MNQTTRLSRHNHAANLVLDVPTNTDEPRPSNTNGADLLTLLALDLHLAYQRTLTSSASPFSSCTCCALCSAVRRSAMGMDGVGFRTVCWLRARPVRRLFAAMVQHAQVLPGESWATSARIGRPLYRNFFTPERATMYRRVPYLRLVNKLALPYRSIRYFTSTAMPITNATTIKVAIAILNSMREVGVTKHTAANHFSGTRHRDRPACDKEMLDRSVRVAVVIWAPNICRTWRTTLTILYRATPDELRRNVPHWTIRRDWDASMRRPRFPRLVLPFAPRQ